MGFWGEFATGLANIACKAIEEKLEYYDSYKKLIREVESKNPNPEEILKSADTFLPLAEKVFEEKSRDLTEITEDDREVLRDNMRKYAEVLFFKGCALLELDRSKEAFKSWGEIIINFRDNADPEVQECRIASYEMLDKYHGCPRCGSCNVKKTKKTAGSLVKNAASQVGSNAGAAVGMAAGSFVFPGIGSAVGGWIGQQLGSIGGEGLAEAAMSGTVRERPDCGYKF